MDCFAATRIRGGCDKCAAVSVKYKKEERNMNNEERKMVKNYRKKIQKEAQHLRLKALR